MKRSALISGAAGAAAGMFVPDSRAAVSQTGDKIRYVSRNYGNDANDGCTWQTAKATIMGAINSTASTGVGKDGSSIIYVGHGHYKEDVVIDRAYTHLVGPSGSFRDNRGARISSLTDAGDCLTITGDSCVIEGISTGSDSPTWNGRGIVLRANRCRITDWIHACKQTPSKFTGGDGLFITHSEGNLFERVTVTARIGLHLTEEATSNTFVAVSSIGCYQDLYMDGVFTENGSARSGPGGNTFIRFKGTGGANSWANGDYAVHLQRKPNAPGGNNVFISCDWSEQLQECHAMIDTDHNVFIGGGSSPQCVTTIAGHCNQIQGFNVLNTLLVTGTQNDLGGITTVGGKVRVTGKRNVVRGVGYPEGQHTGSWIVSPGNRVEQLPGVVTLTTATVKPDPAAGTVFRLTNPGTVTVANPGTSVSATDNFQAEGWTLTFDIVAETVMWGDAYRVREHCPGKPVSFFCDGTAWVQT